VPDLVRPRIEVPHDHLIAQHTRLIRGLAGEDRRPVHQSYGRVNGTTEVQDRTLRRFACVVRSLTKQFADTGEFPVLGQFLEHGVRSVRAHAIHCQNHDVLPGDPFPALDRAVFRH